MCKIPNDIQKKRIKIKIEKIPKDIQKNLLKLTRFLRTFKKKTTTCIKIEKIPKDIQKN